MFLKTTLLNILATITIISAQIITKGPYLVQPNGNAIIIRWEMDRAVEHKFLFGLEEDKLTTVPVSLRAESDQVYLYEARLFHLIPETYYYYRISLPENPGKTHRFKTAPGSDGKLTFVAIGDSRSNPAVFNAIKNQIQKVEPDLVISMGDLVANGGNYLEWQEFYFGIVDEIVDRIPVVSCLGDHEGDDDNGELFRTFFLPDSHVERLWFSFDYGPVHFVALDYRCPNDSRMMDWFQEDMRRSTAKWNFVYMHRPCYNLGGHRSHWGSPHWPELFAKYKVDIVFAGHSHQYERFFPVENSSSSDHWPVTYITSGGAGASTYEVVESKFLAAAAAEHHLSTVWISGDTLQFEAFLTDGDRLDQFKIIKQDGKYHPDYLALAKPQPELDLINMFSNNISFTLNQIPLEDEPAVRNLKLHNVYLDEKINFQISLSPESQPFYRMISYQDTLWYNQVQMLPLEIFSSQKICVSGWGNLEPSLRVQVLFHRGDEEIKILGGECEYWPDDEY